jgi:hypothetical protein
LAPLALTLLSAASSSNSLISSGRISGAGKSSL